MRVEAEIMPKQVPGPEKDLTLPTLREQALSHTARTAYARQRFREVRVACQSPR